MKKTFLLLALLCVCSVIFSQETEEVGQVTKDEKQTKVNEIKVNFILWLPFEISYEQLLKNNVGLGVSAGLTFFQTIDPGEVMYYIMPYGRYYYKFIFVEANTILGRQYLDHYDPVTVYGLGLAVGPKFSLGKNWTIEVSLGGGPLFGYSYDKKVEYYFRAGISFGKRF